MAGNYVGQVLELYGRGEAPAGELTHVDIYHDDWCNIWAGGACNCTPIVRARPPAPRLATDKERSDTGHGKGR